MELIAICFGKSFNTSFWLCTILNHQTQWYMIFSGKPSIWFDILGLLSMVFWWDLILIFSPNFGFICWFVRGSFFYADSTKEINSPSIPVEKIETASSAGDERFVSIRYFYYRVLIVKRNHLQCMWMWRKLSMCNLLSNGQQCFSMVVGWLGWGGPCLGGEIKVSFVHVLSGANGEVDARIKIAGADGIVASGSDM